MRGGGLEPPRVISPLAPQTSASASSAILALVVTRVGGSSNRSLVAPAGRVPRLAALTQAPRIAVRPVAPLEPALRLAGLRQAPALVRPAPPKAEAPGAERNRTP